MKRTKIKQKGLTRTQKESLSWIAIILVMVVLFSGVIFFINYMKSGPFDYSEKRMTVDTGTSERLGIVEINKVLKQKGEEPLYILTITDEEEYTICENIELKKSDYDKYIGKENNCITFEYGYCEILVSDNWFGKYTWKSHEFTAHRYRFPWGENSVSFTPEEVQEFKTAISENKAGTVKNDLPFVINDFAERKIG